MCWCFRYKTERTDGHCSHWRWQFATRGMIVAGVFPVVVLYLPCKISKWGAWIPLNIALIWQLWREQVWRMTLIFILCPIILLMHGILLAIIIPYSCNLWFPALFLPQNTQQSSKINLWVMHFSLTLMWFIEQFWNGWESSKNNFLINAMEMKLKVPISHVHVNPT